jgi:hypothetical protein
MHQPEEERDAVLQLCDLIDAGRCKGACRSTTGTGPTLRYGSVPSRSSLLRRYLLAMGSVIMFVASFLLKRNEPGKGAKVSVH